jgi:hypothetical protein
MNGLPPVTAMVCSGVGGARAVGGADGPAIGIVGDLVGALGEPRFQREGESGAQPQPPSGSPLVGDVWVFVQAASQPVSTELGVDRVAALGGHGTDRCADVTESVAGQRRGDAGGQGSFGGGDQVLVLGLRGSDDHAAGRVGDPALDGHRDVHAQQVAVAKGVVVGQPVQHRVVDRQADDVAERSPPERGGVVPVAGHRAALFDQPAGA